MFFECPPECRGVTVAHLATDVLDRRVAGLEEPAGGVHTAILDVGLWCLSDSVVEAPRERAATESDFPGQVFYPNLS